jgi:hypothetical protein
MFMKHIPVAEIIEVLGSANLGGDITTKLTDFTITMTVRDKHVTDVKISGVSRKAFVAALELVLEEHASLQKQIKDLPDWELNPLDWHKYDQLD